MIHLFDKVDELNKVKVNIYLFQSFERYIVLYTNNVDCIVFSTKTLDLA